MKKNSKYKNFVNDSNFPSFILLCFIIISIVSVSIAFSGGNTALNISGAARFMLAADIRLTGSTLSGATNGGFENYDWKYGKDDLVTGITLPNLNSTVTYEVTVTNFVDINMIFDEVLNISFSNDSMEYDIVGLDLKDTITGIGNTILQVTFKYKDTVTELPENTTLESRIQFKFVEELKKPFKFKRGWDEKDIKDISDRKFYMIETFDKDHNGTPYILAPIQHGVRAYTTTGSIVWSYEGVTNGHDTRYISVGDLLETGYNDTIVACGGQNVNSYQVGIVDKDGNELANIKLATGYICYRSLIVGTDVYLGTNKGVTKLVKSGNTWVEDTVNWDKQIGPVTDIYWGDLGNGPRLLVSTNATQTGLFSYEEDGTLEWNTINSQEGYGGRIETGIVDKTIEGKQIVRLHQGGSKIYDKDGSVLVKLATGTGVRTSVVLYDNDNDGEEEIYIADAGQNIYVWNRTGVNTYTVQYSILHFTTDSNPKDFYGLQGYDIDEDGEKEIIVGSTLGNLYIFSKDLSEKKLELNIGHGHIGANNEPTYPSYIVFSGIKIVDLNGDGHPDMAIPGGLGYVDIYLRDY